MNFPSSSTPFIIHFKISFTKDKNFCKYRELTWNKKRSLLMKKTTIWIKDVVIASNNKSGLFHAFFWFSWCFKCCFDSEKLHITSWAWASTPIQSSRLLWLEYANVTNLLIFNQLKKLHLQRIVISAWFCRKRRRQSGVDQRIVKQSNF